MKKHLLLLLCSLLVALNLQAQQGVGYLDSWPKPNGVVTAVVRSGNIVYIGGNFTQVGGQTRNNLAAINAATGTLTPWNPGANAVVRCMAVGGNTLYVGGDFTTVGGATRNFAAAFNATSGLLTSWNPDANSSVFTLAVSGNTVYAGGAFISIGGQSRYDIAALDATTGTATSWNPHADHYVTALAVRNNTVYAGGFFTTIGGQSRSRIAALDSATGNATSWNPQSTGIVRSLAVNGNTVYAGGPLSAIGGQSRDYIAAIDASTGTATSWNPNANAEVWSLSVSNNTVYAGGFFTSIGGQNRNYIAALDSATGNATSWNPNASSRVLALAVSGSTVYAGGGFTAMGGNNTRSYFMPLVDSAMLPRVSITASANPVCAGTSVTFTATPTNAPSPAYRWTRNSTTISGATAATYTSNALTNNDTIRCLITSGGTTATSNAIVMTVRPIPAAFNLTANAATTFCKGGSVTLSPNANLTGFPNYQWNNNGMPIAGAMSASYTATASGDYTLTVSDSMGCGRTSVVRPVTVNPLPAAAISTAQNPFCAGSAAVLNASPTGTGNTYRWTSGGKLIFGVTGPTYTTSAAGSYAVTITDANGCVGTSPAFALSVKNPPAVFNLTANAATTFCAGSSVTLSPNANFTGFPNYQWSNNGVPIAGAISKSYTATTSGNYTLTVSDSTGCGRTSTARAVTVNQAIASITPANPAALCEGDSVVLTAADASGNTYQWRLNNVSINGATSQSYTATAAGNYSVVVTNNGCTATSNMVTVTVNPLPDVTITPNGPTTFCSGESVKLNVPDATAYQWYDSNVALVGETAASYTATTSGLYTVKVTNAFGCSATSAATDVTVNPLPDVTITPSGPTTFCSGESVALSVSGDASAYQWYNGLAAIAGATSASYTASAGGSYAVKVTNAFDCSILSSVTEVKILCSPIITALSAPSVCDGSSFTASFAATGFNSDNVFTLYLKEVGGAVENPIAIGMVSATGGTTTITGTIPAGTVAGNNYWLYIASSSPAMEGAVYSLPISVRNALTGKVDLCAITVDKISGGNLLMWNPTTSNNIDSFAFSRRDTMGRWQPIGAQVYDGSSSINTWTDADSKPETRAYDYYLMASNACGASTPSDWHRTIHLTINKGTNDSTWNLIWNSYVGVPVYYYNVYRGTSPTNMALLTTVAAFDNYNTFTDQAAPIGENYYMVSVGNEIYCSGGKEEKRALGSGLKIESNIASTKVSGIAASWLDMTLYPNPSTAAGTLLIQSSTAGETFTVRVVDITGRVVAEPQTAVAGHEFSFGATLAPGMYTVEASNGSDKRMIKKWLKQ